MPKDKNVPDIAHTCVPTNVTAVFFVAAITAVLISITFVVLVHTLVSIIALKLIRSTVYGYKGKHRNQVLGNVLVWPNTLV